MNCERATELIIQSLVEPLDSAQSRELDNHLEQCEECRDVVASYREIWNELPIEGKPPPEVYSKLRNSVSSEFGVELTTDYRPERKYFTWVNIAASLVLVVLGSIITLGIQSYTERSDLASIDNRNRYLLIMTATTESAALRDQFNSEFQSWLADLSERSMLETGIGLSDGPPIGTPPDGPIMDLDVSGFIIIRASDDQEARSVTVASPVIDYGGLIEIRRLDD